MFKFNNAKMNLKDEKVFIAYFENMLYHGYSKPFKSLNLLEDREIRSNSSFEFSGSIKLFQCIDNKF